MSIWSIKQKSLTVIAIVLCAASLMAAQFINISIVPADGTWSLSTSGEMPAMADGSQVGTGGG